MEEITAMLREHIDEPYAVFQRKLLPTLAPETILGVRTPVLRSLAHTLSNETCVEAFLKELPHQYFEENQLHGFVLSQRKDFQDCIEGIEVFLPYIDNWATCDQTSPKVFKQHKEALLPYINRWIRSEKPYILRFAIGMLMQHYLDEAFLPEYIDIVAGVQSREYYVNMEIAWYMATALFK